MSVMCKCGLMSSGCQTKRLKFMLCQHCTTLDIISSKLQIPKLQLLTNE